MIAFAREALGLSESTPVQLVPLEGRGSDRTFYRMTWSRKDSAILIHYDPKRAENAFYPGIASFLRDINVPAPCLLRHDPVNCLILMEDLGNIDLWSLRKEDWETRRSLYQKTLTVAHKLHSFPESEFPAAGVRLMEGFGPYLYRWEQNYFRDYFVNKFCGIRLEPPAESQLVEELSALAKQLIGTKRCLIHRDFQSQNVMIRDGEPFLIDFQGMRFGNPFYDLGSLLCDPYAELEGDQRMNLLLYYYNLSRQSLSWSDFQRTFWEASVQRLMQALGAYGFLGITKRLSSYLDHIPAGLRHLLIAVSHSPSLLQLRELIVVCQRRMEGQ